MLFCRPRYRGPSAEKSAFEELGGIFNFRHRQRTVPFHVKRDFRVNWKDPGNGRRGDSQPLRQRIGKVMVVEDVHAMHSEAGTRAVKVNFHGIVPHRNHPEHIVPVNMHVVIVNLVSQLGRSNRTGVDIQSNKRECASVRVAVRADELALAEPHVRLKRQPRGVTSGRVRSRSAAAYVRQAHEAVEIRDLRWIADISQRLGGI